MHKYLSEIDEESAAKIHKNDTQRIKRAIEVFKATGKKFSELQKQHQKVIDKTISSSNLLQFAIRPDDKNLHREKIALRFKKMIEEGLVQEVENILNLEGMSKESQSMKSVGYRQVCEFLDGEVSLDVMITKAINSTRQLSKRQMTWLKSWQNINFLETQPNLSQIVQDFITSSLMIREEVLPKSVIVHIDRFSLNRDLQLEALEEFKELCLSSGTEVCAEVTGKVDRPSPNYFIKQGKVDEIKQLVKSFKTSLVILIRIYLLPREKFRKIFRSQSA